MGTSNLKSPDLGNGNGMFVVVQWDLGRRNLTARETLQSAMEYAWHGGSHLEICTLQFSELVRHGARSGLQGEKPAGYGAMQLRCVGSSGAMAVSHQ